MRILTRGPYSVRHKGRWLLPKKRPHTLIQCEPRQRVNHKAYQYSAVCGEKQEVSDQLPLGNVPSVVYVSPRGRGGGGDIVISFLAIMFPFLFLNFDFHFAILEKWKSEEWKRNHFVPPLSFRSLHHLIKDLFYSFLLFYSEILLMTVYWTSRLVCCINFHGCLHFGSYFWEHLRHFCWRYT